MGFYFHIVIEENHEISLMIMENNPNMNIDKASHTLYKKILVSDKITFSAYVTSTIISHRIYHEYNI